MPDDDTPEPFSDVQRELHGTVARLNRAKPEDFAEAEHWIDTTNPVTAAEEAERWRRAVLHEIRKRRRCRHGGWRRERARKLRAERAVQAGRPPPSKKRIRHCGDDPSYGLRPHSDLMWRQWWEQYWRPVTNTVVQDALAGWRSSRAQGIRIARHDHAGEVREEDKRGARRSDERLGYLAEQLRSLDFGRMDPKTKALWARRLLRYVWILTDTADLSGSSLPWLRDWKWGQYVPGVTSEGVLLAAYFAPDREAGTPLQLPRLYAQMEILDADRDRWESLTRHALEALEEAEPGATAVANTAPVLPRGSVEQRQPLPTLASGVNADPVAVAVALVKDHPDWSDRQMARHVGCHHATLSRSPLYRRAKALAKNPPNTRTGWKTSAGDVEAVDGE